MTLDLESEGSAVIVRQGGLRLLRLLLGVPLTGLGLLFVYAAGSTLVLRGPGPEGWASGLAGSLVSLLLAGLTLPLGWWIAAGRRALVLDPVRQVACERSDWRLWHTERCRPLAPYRAIRVALELVDSAPGSQGRARCQQIRLLASEPWRHPSIEIGALEEAQRDQALAFAQRIAAHLGLPLEVKEDGSVVESPAQIQAGEEQREEDEAESTVGDP